MFGIFTQTIWKHRCPLDQNDVHEGKDDEPKAKKRRYHAKEGDLLLPPPAGVSKDLNKVLVGLADGDIAMVIKSDTLILEVAKKLFVQHGHNTDLHQYIRDKLCEVARLVLQYREKTGETGSKSCKPD